MIYYEVSVKSVQQSLRNIAKYILEVEQFAKKGLIIFQL